MLKLMAGTSLLFAVSASGQVTTYATNNPTPKHGEANKIVCERQEKLGTRLGDHKVCLTVAEWQARRLDDRNQTEKVQVDTRARRSD